jgi:putative aldouronate transport system substrate-binding protein
VKLRSIAALVIVLLIALSSVACGSAPSTSGETTAAVTQATSAAGGETTAAGAIDPMAKYSPGITVTSAKSIDDNIAKSQKSIPDVLTNNIYTKAYEDQLGITLKYDWTAPAAQYDQKLNTQIAANDLPDYVQCNATQFKMLVDYGVAADLTQVYKDYQIPFISDLMNQDHNAAINQCTIGGKLMALPWVNGNMYGPQLWIRKDWLANLGLQDPKTMDDVISIARAFTKNDPDKDGKNNTYGLALTKNLFGDGVGDLSGFANGYHAYYNGWMDDGSGKLVYSNIQPEFKNALAAVAGMFKEGLIDPEFAVKDGSKIQQDLVSGKLGMTFGDHWLAFAVADTKKNSPNSDWDILPIPSADTNPTKVMLGASASRFYVVNKSCKNPEAIVKLYDWTSKYMVRNSLDFIENYNKDASKCSPDEFSILAAVNNDLPNQGLWMERNVEKYLQNKDQSLVDSGVNGLDAILKYMNNGDPTGYSQYMWNGPHSAWTVVAGYENNNQYFTNGYLGAGTDSMAQYNATLQQTQLTDWTKIIMGEADISLFDDYASQWHKLGGDTITQEVNAAK